MSLRQTVAPAAEPLTVAEVGLFLRLTSAVQVLDQADLERIIAAARANCEQHSERQLITATWKLTLDSFPAGAGGIILPRPKLQAVSSVAYTDENGGSQTLDSSLYSVDTENEPGWILPAYGEDWPATRAQANAVAITYTAGYGDDAADVPDELKALMLAEIQQRYDNRPGPWNLEHVERGYRKYWHGIMDAHV